MRLATCLRYFYLTYFSKPASDRAIYRAIRRTRATRVLEIGIGCPVRTLRMIHLARRFAGADAVRYAAIDLFEARGATTSKRLSLKEAHRLLQPTAAKIQLIPGEPAGALRRVANSLPNVDVLLISAEQSDAALAEAWFYFPRMLHGSSAVFREIAHSESDGTTAIRRLDQDEIRALAGGTRRQAA